MTLFQKMLADTIYGVLIAHGWYRDWFHPAPRRKPEPSLPPPSPVVILARTREEADRIATLLDDDQEVLGYIPRAQRDQA